MRPQIILHLSYEIESRYPEAWGTHVHVMTINDQRLETSRKHTKADPQNLLFESELYKKTLDLMIFGRMTKPTADALSKKYLNLSVIGPYAIRNYFIQSYQIS